MAGFERVRSAASRTCCTLCYHLSILESRPVRACRFPVERIQWFRLATCNLIASVKAILFSENHYIFVSGLVAAKYTLSSI